MEKDGSWLIRVGFKASGFVEDLHGRRRQYASVFHQFGQDWIMKKGVEFLLVGGRAKNAHRVRVLDSAQYLDKTNTCGRSPGSVAVEYWFPEIVVLNGVVDKCVNHC